MIGLLFLFCGYLTLKFFGRCNKIPKFAVLIDPNKGEATERMFNALKDILEASEKPAELPMEIWVGDSHEIYRGVHKYLRRLHRLDIELPPVVIFPGHPLQISSLADFIQMPTLLNTHRFIIKVLVKLGKKYHWIAKWIRKPFGYHWPIDRKYGYIVLSPDSTVGRKLRAIELNDAEAYDEITKHWRPYWTGLYIEAGSGNYKKSIATRLDLVSRVKDFMTKKNPQALLYTGGGIRTKEQVESLVKAGSDIVVVSSVLEESNDPKKLMEQFLDAVSSI